MRPRVIRLMEMWRTWFGVMAASMQSLMRKLRGRFTACRFDYRGPLSPTPLPPGARGFNCIVFRLWSLLPSPLAGEGLGRSDASGGEIDTTRIVDHDRYYPPRRHHRRHWLLPRAYPSH